ncbi:hypothetical protein [uncultured Parabacteroides sp.]|jgi:hypothetical protein|uniref:hypothetical protein n=1 Tax=uncultured Parabacteroides sp. TaxID=512312 RepID=UPI0025D21ECF|nr:hypothetical protein [uncultured Parabacteroides sp.]
MKKIIFLWAILSIGMMCNHVSAQKELGIFNSLSVGVSAGTTGIGIDVATPVTPHFAIRGGVSFMPGFSFDTDVDVDLKDSKLEENSSLNLTGNMKRASGELLVNYYPFLSSSFFVTAGAYFGGNKLLKVKGHSDELAEYVQEGGQAGIIIGDQVIPVDKNGNVSGGFKVSGFRPYIGVGFGRAVPKKRIGVQFELGVQFHGSPKLYSSDGDLSGALADSDDDFTKVMDKLTVYPVMKVRFCGRLF